MLIRMFKRLVYLSIKVEHGYLKRFVNEPRVSISILCEELEISPAVLILFELNPIL